MANKAINDNDCVVKHQIRYADGTPVPVDENDDFMIAQGGWCNTTFGSDGVPVPLRDWQGLGNDMFGSYPVVHPDTEETAVSAADTYETPYNLVATLEADELNPVQDVFEDFIHNLITDTLGRYYNELTIDEYSIINVDFQFESDPVYNYYYGYVIEGYEQGIEPVQSPLVVQGYHFDTSDPHVGVARIEAPVTFVLENRDMPEFFGCIEGSEYTKVEANASILVADVARAARDEILTTLPVYSYPHNTVRYENFQDNPDVEDYEHQLRATSHLQVFDQTDDPTEVLLYHNGVKVEDSVGNNMGGEFWVGDPYYQGQENAGARYIAAQVIDDPNDTPDTRYWTRFEMAGYKTQMFFDRWGSPAAVEGKSFITATNNFQAADETLFEVQYEGSILSAPLAGTGTRNVGADENGKLVISSSPVDMSFLGLNDTPDNYTGEAGKAVVVNSTEDGVEFTALAGLTGDENNTTRFNSDEEQVETRVLQVWEGTSVWGQDAVIIDSSNESGQGGTLLVGKGFVADPFEYNPFIEIKSAYEMLGEQLSQITLSNSNARLIIQQTGDGLDFIDCSNSTHSVFTVDIDGDATCHDLIAENDVYVKGIELGTNVNIVGVDSEERLIAVAASDLQSDWNEASTSSNAYIKNKPTIPVGLPTGTDTQTLRNISGTWTADGALTIKKPSDLYPIMLFVDGTTAPDGTNKESLITVTHRSGGVHNNATTCYLAQIDGMSTALSGFKVESVIAASNTYSPIGFNVYAGSDKRIRPFYAYIATGHANDAIIDISGGANTVYNILSKNYGTTTFHVKKDGTVMSDSLTASTPLKTNASKEIISGAFGTSAGQFAEGNHTHVGLVHQVKVTLTKSQIESLHTTQVQAIAAPGSGKFIAVQRIAFRSGATNGFSGNFMMRHGNDEDNAMNLIMVCSNFTTQIQSTPISYAAPLENAAINFYATSAITDSGTSDSYEFWIEYTIIDL